MDENAQHITVLVDSAPQVALIAADGGENLVDEPVIAERTLALPKLLMPRFI